MARFFRRRKQTNPYNGEMLHRRRTFGWLIGCLILVAVVAVAVIVFSRPFYSTMMPYNGGWFFFPFGFFIFFFIIFGLGRLIFWPWGYGWRRGYWYRHDGAGQILRERYARGEITKEQFEQMMKDLEQHS